MFKSYIEEWLSNPGKNLLAGIVVALALIPEAIAFSIIAGVVSNGRIVRCFYYCYDNFNSRR